MLVAQSVGYSGAQSNSGFIGFLHEENLFAAISIEDGTTIEAGEALLNELKQELQKTQITNLSTFESQITNTIVKLNFPTHFSLAIGYLYNDALYIKTVGSGQIYFRRGKDFDLLMDGDKSASGYLQEYDLAIFTTAKINDLLGSVEDIKAFVDLNPPKEISEKMMNEDYGEDATGYVGLFVEFLSQEAAEVLPPPETAEVHVNSTLVSEQALESSKASDPAFASSTEPLDQQKPEGTHPPPVTVPPFPSTPSPVPPSQPTIEDRPEGTPATPPPPVAEPPKPQRGIPFLSGFQFRQSRKISMVIVVILFGILLWSVVFGYQRRIAQEQQQKLETTKEQIQTNLEKAEADAYLDFEGSLQLIEESKEQLDILRTELGEAKAEEIAKIATLIDQTEAKIVKRDEKEATEFYDLGLESENAQGDSIYLENENVAILDKINNTVYILSLESKSIDKYTAPEVGGAIKVATYDGSVFFLNPEKGVYEFNTATKAEVVIEPKGWENVVDMQLYNGNIYVLDQGNDEVYKYLVAANGYSDANPYFVEGQSVSLADSVGMAIDSAIYIAREQDVLKFVSGAADPFTTKYPESGPMLSGIFTSADIEQVYVWDNKTGSIYMLEKDGEYIKQIASSVVREAKGIFIYGEDAYIFDGKKLYTVALD